MSEAITVWIVYYSSFDGEARPLRAYASAERANDDLGILQTNPVNGHQFKVMEVPFYGGRIAKDKLA